MRSLARCVLRCTALCHAVLAASTCCCMHRTAIPGRQVPISLPRICCPNPPPLAARLRCCACSWLEDAAADGGEGHVLDAALRLLRLMPFQAPVLEQSGEC